MIQIFQLISCIALGTILACIFGLRGLEQQGWYLLTAAALLAIGLYGSTHGIILKEARQHIRIIALAVTVGVLGKALFVGGVLALVFGRPEYLLLGIVVAQIDPLSVAGLMRGTRLSDRAKTILGSWASFDDPVTVLLALYAPLLIGKVIGNDLSAIGDGHNDFGSYLAGLALNIAFAAAVFVVLKFAAYFLRSYKILLKITVYYVLALALALAAGAFWMLGIALIGLFLRPPIERLLEHAISWALRVAAVLVGLLLIGGVNLGAAIILGVAAFVAQIIAGTLLTFGLPKKDRWHIAFAQQNGITAIILALLFEPGYPGTVAIVAPAIIVINVLHYGSNKLIDKHVLKEQAA